MISASNILLSFPWLKNYLERFHILSCDLLCLERICWPWGQLLLTWLNAFHHLAVTVCMPWINNIGIQFYTAETPQYFSPFPFFIVAICRYLMSLLEEKGNFLHLGHMNSLKPSHVVLSLELGTVVFHDQHAIICVSPSSYFTGRHSESYSSSIWNRSASWVASSQTFWIQHGFWSGSKYTVVCI